VNFLVLVTDTSLRRTDSLPLSQYGAVRFGTVGLQGNPVVEVSQQPPRPKFLCVLGVWGGSRSRSHIGSQGVWGEG